MAFNKWRSVFEVSAKQLTPIRRYCWRIQLRFDVSINIFFCNCMCWYALLCATITFLISWSYICAHLVFCVIDAMKNTDTTDTGIACSFSATDSVSPHTSSAVTSYREGWTAVGEIIRTSVYYMHAWRQKCYFYLMRLLTFLIFGTHKCYM